MPKESVFGEQHAPYGDDAKPMVPVIEVRWGREDGTVQIVSRAEDAYGGRWAEDVAPDILRTDVHFTDGYFVNLSRTAINQLIRNLRRARDQAFGRDE